MSEKQPQFNPLAQAQLDADRGRAIYNEFMVNPEKGYVEPQAAEDYIAYDNVRNAGFDTVEDQQAYHDRMISHVEDTISVAYEDMGTLELARALAQAELAEDKTSMHNINDAVENKIINTYGVLSEAEAANMLEGGKNDPTVYTEKAAVVVNDRQLAVLDRFINYKEAYKAKIQSVEGGPSNEQLAQEKNSSIRDRIDPGIAQTVSEGYKNAGVPDEVVANVPNEYFFKADDPERVDPAQIAPNVVEWAKEQQAKAEQAQPEPAAPEATKVKEAEAVETPAEEEPVAKLSWKERIKRWRNPRLAARDTGDYEVASIEKYRGERRKVAAGLGSLALLTAGAYLVAKGMPGLPFGGGTGIKEQAAQLDPSTGGIFDSSNDLGSMPGGETVDTAGSGAEGSNSGGTEVNSGDTDQNTAEQMRTFDVHQGEGFTQVIERMPEANGLSAEQLNEVAQYGFDHDLIDTSYNTYQMPNGDYGIADPSKSVRINEDQIIAYIESLKTKD